MKIVQFVSELRQYEAVPDTAIFLIGIGMRKLLLLFNVNLRFGNFRVSRLYAHTGGTLLSY